MSRGLASPKLNFLFRPSCKLYDVEQNLLFNFYNILILGFLCNICYFKFRVIISLFLGVFNVVQSNQGFEDFSSHLVTIGFILFQYLNILQPLKAITIIINNLFISQGTSCGFVVHDQKLLVKFLFLLKEYHVCFFLTSAISVFGSCIISICMW